MLVLLVQAVLVLLVQAQTQSTHRMRFSRHCTRRLAHALVLLHDCDSLLVPAEGEGKNSKPAANHSMMTAIALYDKAGDLIYMGQSKGTITVLDAVSLKFLDVVKVCTKRHHIQGVWHIQQAICSWA